MAKCNRRKGKKNDLQKITQKTKDGTTRTPCPSGGELKCSGRVGTSCSTCGQTEYIRCHLWYKYSVSSNKKSWRWPYNLLVPSTVIFRKELSCWRKSNSIKATFPLGWSHRYKNSTVVITNWLTRWEISISQMTTDLFPFRRLLSFLYYRTWRYE